MTISDKARESLANHLRRKIAGDVLSDPFSRGRYASDASPFQSFPAAIALPKTMDDLLAVVQAAWDKGVSVVARGGGTGRAGQAVGEGLIVDLSRYLTRLLYVDASAQSCIVEPGLTPKALNAAVEAEKLWFPVEIGSAAQATLGGMAATDAIGRWVLHYGRMRDNITACDVILPHGAEVSFHDVPPDFSGEAAGGEEAALILDLLEATENREAAIAALASIAAGQHGYNLRALLPGEGQQNAAAFLAGSEGTLAITKRLELKLARRPTNRAIGVCHFSSLSDALTATQRILALQPIAIELSSLAILNAGFPGRKPPEPVRRFFTKDGGSLLFVEFMERNRAGLARKLKNLADLMAEQRHARNVSEVLGPGAQEAVYQAHHNGLSALYMRTELASSVTAVSELALPLDQLAAAAADIEALFERNGLEVIWHGHVGAGMLNVRPWLKSGSPSRDLTALARDAAAIFKDFAGRMSVVEGHGVARSFEIEALRPPELTKLLEDVKARFDPQGRFNPGKIVMPAKPAPEMMRKAPPDDLSAALSALNCNGTALCRQIDDTVMCPSYHLTRNERDSPRGRANTLRLALTGDLGRNALGSDAMAETMALCVPCKACRSECPRGVDIAQAKIMTQSERIRLYGAKRFDETISSLPALAPRLQKWRHLLALRDLLPRAGTLSEWMTGLSAHRPWPRPSRPGRRLIAGDGPEDGPELVLFADTLNNHFDEVTLQCALDVLAASGFRVTVMAPPKGERAYCCGRLHLEAGMLDAARAEGRRLIDAARPHIDRGARLVGLEPSCLLTIRDEMSSMLSLDGAAGLAKNAFLFEEVMTWPGVREIIVPKLMPMETGVLVAPHCHQRAFNTAESARELAGYVPGITTIAAKPGCCGMGVSFGYNPETVEDSLRIGEMSLFPAIRNASRDTLVVSDGHGCRKQISDGTGRTARHTAVLLKIALDAKEKFGEAENGDATESRRITKRMTRLRKTYFK